MSDQDPETDQTDHRSKMQKVQAAHRDKVAQSKTPERGLVLVHTGPGKGKSSSAFGVLIRALGWGKSVAVVQFIKGKWITGERRFFEKLGGVTWHTMGEGFTWDTQDRDRDIAAAGAAFDKARALMASGDHDVVLLDEINIAMRYDYLGTQEVLDGLAARSPRTSVILTGRDAKPELCDYADLVSEIAAVKHPYEAGIKAQKGIDF
ncbi:MAG: cob(I)yrinic acid a,c-diamide adenosyltransferase [Pseudomonadota bacterium]